MNEPNVPDWVAFVFGLALVAATSVHIAVEWLAHRPVDASTGSVLMLGFAGIVWPSISKLKTPFGEIERKIGEAAQKAEAQVRATADTAKKEIVEAADEGAATPLVATNIRPSRKRPKPAKVTVADRIAEAEARLPEPTHQDDPQKGRFGGKSENQGVKLSAKVKPDGDEWYSVQLKIESTTGVRLTGPAKIFVHDSFDPNTWMVSPRSGVIRARFGAYGAFTVGAICSDGTLLELDLADASQVQQPDAAFKDA